MLDFDDKELLEGFEEEFKKKKRNKRSENRFPSWIIVTIILVAAIFFFLNKRPDTVKVQISETPRTEFTEVQQFSVSTQQISSSTILSTEEGKTTKIVSTAQLKGVPDHVTSTPYERSEKITAGTDAVLTGSSLIQTSGTVVPNTTASVQLAIADTAIPVVSATVMMDSKPTKNAASEKDESLKITPTTAEDSEKTTYNLNFFQRILFSLNPNWVSVPSLTPTVTVLPNITEENPFLNETESGNLVSSKHPEVENLERPEISETIYSEISLTITPIAETAVQKTANTQVFSQSITTLSEKKINESVKDTNKSVAIENLVEGTPQLTHSPDPLMSSSISAQLGEKVSDTLFPTREQASSDQMVSTSGSVEYLSGTIVVPIISLNDQSGTENPIVSPSASHSTIIPVAPSSEVVSESASTNVSTPSPVPTVEPTQQPNVFQRFYYFIFPGAQNTETVQTPTNSPTVTSTAPIDEVQPTQKPNIFQRFITFIIPGRDEPTPTVTSVPTIPHTATAPAIESTSLSTPSLSPTAFIPQRDSSLEETQVPTERMFSNAELETSEEISTAELLLQLTNGSTDYLNKNENTPSPEKVKSIQPESNTVIPIQNDSENRIELNPRLIMFGNTPTAEATEILVVVGKNVGTEVVVTQSTALPKTGVADKWNIPMMILVVMVLLALILGIRLLRNKYS